MNTLMQTRTIATLPRNSGHRGFPLRESARRAALGSFPGSRPTNEVYAPSVTAGIYLVNFVFLYIANPDLAAYLPAYKAPIPQPVVDCLEQNPTGCPYADYRPYFDEPTVAVIENRECFWPEVCQENARWARLAPRKFRQPGDINEPLGSRRADQLAHLLGMDAGMISDATKIPLPDRDTSERSQTEKSSSIASITSPTRMATQSFPSPATGLTSLSREIFEAFARPMRRVSSSTLC